MHELDTRWVVQIGATRDGLDPYREVADASDMSCALIETPDYLAWREEHGRPKFKREIPVEHPSDPQQIVAAIGSMGLAPQAVLAGFERYNPVTYEVAKRLEIHPYSPDDEFSPLTKIETRERLRSYPEVLQPNYVALSSPDITPEIVENVQFPLVVKPIDGGGGLGTFKVGNYKALQKALRELKSTKNYGGEDFAGFMIEEAVPGEEFSVQGVARNGKVDLFSVCRKIIFTEPVGEDRWAFREGAHIAVAGDEADEDLKQWVQACATATGYKNGPFLIDGIKTPRGRYFLEKNQRLSGFGVSQLVNKVSGYNWAAEAFAALLRRPSYGRIRSPLPGCIGELRARHESELVNAEAQNNPSVTVGRALPIVLPAHVSEQLRPDLTRHSGTLGKITVRAASVDEAERLLISCLAERAEHRVS